MIENGWQKSSEVLDGNTITIYSRPKEGLPLIVMNSYQETGEMILHSCVKHDCPAFQLVSISGIQWDEVLSPWPESPVVTPEDHFTGGAKEYSEWMDTALLPNVRKKLPTVRETIIAGYSMAGLFAVYAPYVSESYDKCVCASGSVWFPGFLKFARTTPFKRKPQAVYFSLGNKETHSNIEALTTTKNVMCDLEAFYKSEGILSTFEENSGNHYTDVPARMAKSFGWIIRAGHTEKEERG